MPKQTFKKWRVGLWLAVAIAFLSSGVNIAADMTWKQFIGALCASLLSGLTGYLAKSPLQEVEEEPETTNNEPPKTT